MLLGTSALFKKLKEKSVHLKYDVQEKLDVLRSSGSSAEKECSHKELMDLNKVHDFITGIFFWSTTMSNMTEYWKNVIPMCDALFLSTYADHFKI